MFYSVSSLYVRSASPPITDVNAVGFGTLEWFWWFYLHAIWKERTTLKSRRFEAGIPTTMVNRFIISLEAGSCNLPTGFLPMCHFACKIGKLTHRQNYTKHKLRFAWDKIAYVSFGVWSYCREIAIFSKTPCVHFANLLYIPAQFIRSFTYCSLRGLKKIFNLTNLM
jgi:hypothetical protein